MRVHPKPLSKPIIAAALSIFASLTFSTAHATTMDVVCSYAPSQSKAAAAITGTTGGAAATTAALGEALGLTAVAHSSGALILTGSGGYVAGTLGSATAAPIIVGVGVVVAGTAATVELICAPKNHPEYVAKVYDAADKFKEEAADYVQQAKEGLKEHWDSAVDVKTEILGKVSAKSAELYQRYSKNGDSQE